MANILPLGTGLPAKTLALNAISEDIISASQDNRPNQPFLMNLVTLQKLFFQGLPQKIEYNPESNFVAVAVPGRNAPLYQYTGSEDSIELVLTWYSNEESRADVLVKCKWIEALSKNNGYEQGPPLVLLCFGYLFQDAKWIVEKAPYTIGRFNREFGMLPSYAEQKIILKRYSVENPLRSDYLKYTY